MNIFGCIGKNCDMTTFVFSRHFTPIPSQVHQLPVGRFTNKGGSSRWRLQHGLINFPFKLKLNNSTCNFRTVGKKFRLPPLSLCSHAQKVIGLFQLKTLYVFFVAQCTYLCTYCRHFTSLHNYPVKVPGSPRSIFAFFNTIA